MGKRICLWYGWDSDESEKVLTPYPGEYRNHRLADESEMTAREIARVLDQNAEADNYHELNGQHRWLAETIEQHGDGQVATRVMVDLLKRGGLHRG